MVGATAFPVKVPQSGNHPQQNSPLRENTLSHQENGLLIEGVKLSLNVELYCGRNPDDPHLTSGDQSVHSPGPG